ncbi:MAG: hypothetical protein B6242_08335 [Anaerolineaceae bacterium 4572_78]|nr:MAG: hypothetical protein B6242_08335 [Anaerolineaceae bacterium 4572_78]
MTVNVLKDLASNLDDIIGLGVVGKDGMSIASHFVSEEINGERVAAAISQLINQATKSVALIGAGDIQETITSTDKYLMIARPIGSGKYFIQLILHTTANLGVARLYLEEFSEPLLKSLPSIAH